jgi:inner membrane protein
MATIFTHPLVPITIGLIAGKDRVSSKLMLWSAVASIIPDGDVIAFNFGISYASEFGHRGFTHSIIFAVFIGLIGILMHKQLKATKVWAFAMLFLGAVSHPFLDAFTNGGLGVAAFWPVTDARYFWPVSPIEVSPIGAGFFSARGAAVLMSELVWVVMPLFVAGAVGRYIVRETLEKEEGLDNVGS